MLKYFRLILGLPLSVKWLLFTEMLYGFSMGIWGVNLNFHLIDKGFSNVNIGNLLAFGFIITAVVALVSGALGSKFGHTKAMVVGCMVRGLGIIFMALSNRTEFIFLGQALFSIGGALISSSEFPLLLDLLEEKQMQVAYNLSFSVYQFSMFFGNIIGGFIPEWLHNQIEHYKITIVICGILYLLMAFFRLFLPNKKGQASSNISYFKVSNIPMISMFLLFGLFDGVIANIILPLSQVNTFYRQSFNLSDESIGLLYSLSTLLSGIAFFIAPILLEKFDNSKITIFVLLLCSFCFVLFSFVPLLLFIIIWLAFSFIISIIPGSAESNMLKAVPQSQRGMYCGLGISSNSLGMGIGATLSGYFLTNVSYTGLMITGAIVILIQLGVYIFGIQRYVHPKEDIIWTAIDAKAEKVVFE